MTSVAMRGKLWYHDNDTVGHLFYQRHPQPPSEATLAEGLRLGATMTADETIWKHRRAAGFVLGSGVHQSFFDLHGGYFDAPEIMDEVSRLNRVLDKSVDDDRTSCSEILVVTDEAACAYASFNSPLLEQSLRMPQAALTKIGAPHDSILLEDLPRVDLKRYKLVLFMNAYVLTSRQQRFIAANVMADGRTVAWFGTPGLVADGGSCRESLLDVTGIGMAVLRDSPAVASWMELDDSDALLSVAMKLEGLRTMGHGTRCYLPIRLDDNRAKVLARLAGGAVPSLVVKDLETCRSIYCITPALPARFFRVLARSSGVHVYLDRDDTFYACQSYATIAADGDGLRTLHLPRTYDIYDPISGDALAKCSQVYSQPLRDKQTLILRITRPNAAARAADESFRGC